MSEEIFYRGNELARTPSALPALIYNLAFLLVQRSRNGSVFVPIRPMQYLAVLDSEEYIFVDREHPQNVELAWRDFKPNTRTSLTEPVPFDVVYYVDQGHQTMQRLHSEFALALKLLAKKQPLYPEPAKIIPLSK